MRGHAFALADGSALRITVRIGQSCHAALAEHDTLDTLLSQADAALYQAKSSGRDRVVTVSH